VFNISFRARECVDAYRAAHARTRALAIERRAE